MSTLFRISALTLTLLASGCVITSASAEGERHRELEQTLASQGLERVHIDGGAGEVRIRASADDQIHVHVRLSRSDSGWFSAKPTFETLNLDSERAGKTLNLKVEGKNFGEDWDVELPAGLAVSVDSGVGDVRIEGVSGDIEVDHGVGDVRITASAEDIAAIDLDSGVGSTRVIGGDAKASRRTLVGSDVKWEGAGHQHIHADVGVGDANVRLN